SCSFASCIVLSLEAAGRPGRSSGVSNRVMAWLAWFVGLNVLCLVFTSAFVLAEAVLGVVASAIAATAAEAVREQGLTRFKPRARWFLRARVLPWRAATEAGVVLRGRV